MRINYNSEYIDIIPSDDSYRYRTIMGENALTLTFSLADHFDFLLGAWCEFEGDTYTLEQPSSFVKQNSKHFKYTLIMEGYQAKLKKYKLRNMVDKRLKFSYTAKPHEHLQQLVDNLNLRDPGWTVGQYIDAPEKVISYNHTFCLDALNNIATDFETEWQIIGKVINLKRVEYNEETPLALSYGRGNGFKSGVSRTNDSKKKAVEILYVQGGERNIDFSKYGTKELLLPKSQGQIYKGNTYITDIDGYYIKRIDKALQTREEDSIDLSHIYPSRTGTVSQVIESNPDNDFYDFYDNLIPLDLNYSDSQIDGTTMTVIFQSGILTGKEFEVNYTHSSRKFEIVNQEIDGMTMPNDTYKPSVGDTYVVFNIMLPDAYICDNVAKSGGSWDMFNEAVRYMYNNENPSFSFTGELDGIWSKKDWLNIGGKIVLGGHVEFTDDQFQTDPILIRIMGIKDEINNPHSPIIELSNAASSVGLSSELIKLDAKEVYTNDQHEEALQFVRRSFNSAKETIKLLEDALLHFTGSINPIAVSTMSLLIGSESLQFRFVDDKTTPVKVAHSISFDNTSKILNAQAGIIQHMTFGIDKVQPTREVSDYTFWDVSGFNSPALVDADKAYYLYIRANKNNSTSTFYLSESALEMSPSGDYYYFLTGFLNSEFEGERNFVKMYGFTEILPGQITTDVVATNTLLAELARIADWIIRNGKITSIGSTDGVPWAELDGTNGAIKFNKNGVSVNVGIVGDDPVISLEKGLNSYKLKADSDDVGMTLISSDGINTASCYIGSLYGGFVSAKFLRGNNMSEINDKGIVVQGTGGQSKPPARGALLELKPYPVNAAVEGLRINAYGGRAANLNGDLLMNGLIDAKSNINLTGDLVLGSSASRIQNFAHTGKKSKTVILGDAASFSFDAAHYDYLSVSHTGTSYINILTAGVTIGKQIVIVNRRNDMGNLVVNGIVNSGNNVNMNGGAVLTLIYDPNTKSPSSSSNWIITAYRDNNW